MGLLNGTENLFKSDLIDKPSRGLRHKDVQRRRHRGGRH
jgi:hypothetical protein